MYSASKSAVIAFTKALGKMTKSTNVRVVALCPWYTDTRMVVAVTGGPKTPELEKKLMSTRYVAQAFEHLVQDENNTGEALLVTKEKVQYHKIASKL